MSATPSTPLAIALLRGHRHVLHEPAHEPAGQLDPDQAQTIARLVEATLDGLELEPEQRTAALETLRRKLVEAERESDR